MFAADGAGSEVRRALVASGAIEAREELLDHGYKELTLAATPAATSRSSRTHCTSGRAAASC